MDVKAFIPGVGLFEGLDDREVEKIAGLCQMDGCDPGELVWREGDDAEFLCLVSEGRIDLRFEIPGRESTQEQAMIAVFPGNAFGWSALVPPYKMTLSSFGGDEGARFCRINGKELIRLFEANPRIGYICYRNLSQVIAKRFHALEDEIARHLGLDVMHQW